MWEFFSHVVDVFGPVGSVFVAGSLAAFGLYVFKHLKRDKNGKFYWYSNVYELTKNTHKQMCSDIKDVKETVVHLNTKFDNMAKVVDEHTVQIKAITKELRDNSADTLKLFIYGETQPLIERCYAAVRYLSLGYNSDTKRFIEEELKPKSPEIYHAAEVALAKVTAAEKGESNDTPSI